jgi:hypothetical protein
LMLPKIHDLDEAKHKFTYSPGRPTPLIGRRPTCPSSLRGTN